ncbi:hypothetical protein [Actinomyces capricornis]|uniref:t-SNARE coiled-coil homology domain-containing protein n=1 Tax=Actinomyces capricornis TaxID=2755559 RepID=A0ABN6K8A0_9ACTO|nr:hypothetical protein [Actinomyces capricornis]BDA65723.1 hypothetical protein MANAM107_25570 [Actinomyces capricornis]
MTNEDISKQIQQLNETVTAMAGTMQDKFQQIDKRFEQIDRRFESIDEQLADIRQDNKNLTDIVKDLELRMEARFVELHEGQAELRSSISDLRYQLFHEEGAREIVDESIYQDLDKRLRLVEAKFPELAQQPAA